MQNNKFNNKTKFILLLTIIHFIIVITYLTIYLSENYYSVNTFILVLIGYICFSFIIVIIIIICSINEIKNKNGKIINICCLLFSLVYLIFYIIWLIQNHYTFFYIFHKIIYEIKMFFYII